MEIRYATNPRDFKNYDNERVREDFLIDSLFEKGNVNMIYSHYDRLIVGGAVPTNSPLHLEDKETLKTEFFLERREVGFFNISNSKGKITVDGKVYELDHRDCLYVGKGHKNILIESIDSNDPAKIYIVSATAHKNYPTQKKSLQEATHRHLGDDAQSNKRDLYQYIHADGIQSCQLMMGMTFLSENNMWNTMPPHVHDRRMEAYLYFDLEDDEKVMHFMGKPNDTRNIVVSNEQAVLSPPWSIHSGVGTKNYTFIWAMAGENYTFDDMDHVDKNKLK